MNTVTDASLAEELPYWDFATEGFTHIVLSDGAVVSGIEVTLLDVECADDRTINDLMIGLRSLLDSIAEEVSVQFHFSVNGDFSETIEKHSQGFVQHVHPLVHKIATVRTLKLKESLCNNELYRPQLKIYLMVKPKPFKRMSFLKSDEQFHLSSVSQYEETVDQLSQNVDTLLLGLKNLGIDARKIAVTELKQEIYKFLNPKRSKTEPAPQIVFEENFELENELLIDSPWMCEQSVRNQMVFGDLIVEREQFTLDSHFHRIISLKTLPEMTHAGQLAGFLNLPFQFELFLSFEVPPQASEMSKLNQKRKMAHSLAMTSGNKVSDLESETKLSSTEELIRELLSTGQRIYAVQLNLVLKAPATDEGNKVLNKQVREVLSRLRALQGAEGLEESVGAWKICRGNLPAAPVKLERARRMKTNNLADFLPIYGPRKGDEDPVVVFRNRLNGLIGFDQFDSSLSNYSSLVTGSSGAGKSFLNNCILLQQLTRNLRVFVIDIGGSYKKLTECLDGQYLELNMNEEYRINPFALSDSSKDPPDQKVKSILAIVESMVTDEESTKLSKLERTLLEKVITDLYKEMLPGKIPTLTDLREKLRESHEPVLQTMAKLLYSWTGDTPYGKLLDGSGTLRTDTQICTFDLKNLSSYPDLQRVLILILTDFILTEVESDRTVRNRIILDEAWALLKSPAAAAFMEYCVRTLRKTGGGSGITFITQGVEEIVASPIGAAILNNTASKFIMLQRGNTEVLKNALKLNDRELDLIYSLEQKKGVYSEGFMIEGDQRQVVRIYPTPFEYWLSTSDPMDNGYLDELVASGIPLKAAIERAASEYPQGLSAGRKQT